jgi:hypothetical protein
MNQAPIRPKDLEHITIYYDATQFAAWPFNHGFWAFSEQELLIGFSRGACSYGSAYDMSHSVVDARGGEYVMLRSTDGGRSWPLHGMQSLGSRQAVEKPLFDQPGTRLTKAYDWASPDFCMTAGFGIPPQRNQNVGYIQVSADRGQTWEGPILMPAFGFSWIQVKPDYLVRPDGLILLFVTVGIGDGRAGTRFVAVYGSPDGGLTWNYLSPILATAPDTHFVNRYYASPIQLADGRILVALRCQIDAVNAWPEIFESADGGRTWQFLSRPSDWGGPSHLTLLDDGRILLVYGYRVVPYGIRGRISEDGGKTWGTEIILRDDAGSWDLGYPRTVKLGDGRVMVAYYFNNRDDSIQQSGGVRHIAGTIFKP